MTGGERDRELWRQIAERARRGEMWEQEMHHSGGQGTVTVLYASGGQVVLRPGESVWVKVTNVVEEDGRVVSRFFPIDWKYEGSA